MHAINHDQPHRSFEGFMKRHARSVMRKNALPILNLDAPRKRPFTRAIARALIVGLLGALMPPVSHADTVQSPTLPAGWHLLSVPIQPANPAPHYVLSNVAPPLHVYDYVSGLTTGIGETGFRNFTAGLAEWTLLPASTTIQVTGSPV